ncbi:MAG: DUF2157 domain-containing protein [Anaerolineales bacterium]|nr:DUF2157 domain-containing protein [Anaerolineales bacterium]
MTCPSCGAPEEARVKVCRNCGEAYASQDILELRNLQFLLRTTAGWGVPEELRSPYEDRFLELQARLSRGKQEVEAQDIKKAAMEIAEPVQDRSRPETSPDEVDRLVSRQRRERERVPFDQWLLSDRNIKIALYSGGLLLLLAGLIFIGVSWTRIPGPGKFAVMSMVTGLTFLGGYHLFKRRAYRLGGNALLCIACGFLALDFAILQIYVLGPSGLSNDVMWLIASVACLLIYAVMGYWTRSDAFTYISLAALASATTAGLVLVSAEEFMFLVVYALLSCAVLGLAWSLEETSLADFTCQALKITSHVAMPIIILAALLGWTIEHGCKECGMGSPWLAILTLGIGVLFYVITDIAYRWKAVRWVTAVLIVFVFGMSMVELSVERGVMGGVLIALAIVYLGLGYQLEQREGSKGGSWPFYITAYIVALLVTSQAVTDKGDLALVLLGDVVLLVVSAVIHRNYYWVYGAAWLLMVPVYLYISMFESDTAKQGLMMGVLGMAYLALGFVLGQRRIALGGPFLTAAACLSIVIPVLTWRDPLIASVVLGAIAVLYLLAAIWLDWPWLLLPATLALNAGVVALLRQLIGPVRTTMLEDALTLSLAFIGFALAIGGFTLRRANKGRWVWPVYLASTLNLTVAYLAALYLGDFLAIGLSIALAVLLLTLTWFERDVFQKYKFPPLLTYLGTFVIFVGHFYAINMIGDTTVEIWPAITSILCGSYVVISWLSEKPGWKEIYAVPFRNAGLSLMVIAMAGSIIALEPLLVAITFTIAAVIYAIDAVLTKKLYLAYASLGAFVIVVWALLREFDISEIQAYVIPACLALLGAGWSERAQGRTITYRLTTAFGVLVMTGTSLVQSLSEGDHVYAILLAVESSLAVGWGYVRRSRDYVQWGVITLIVNAIVQFWPAFVEFPRWIQLGLTGGFLLCVGLAALFKREEILSARQALGETWSRWEP